MSGRIPLPACLLAGGSGLTAVNSAGRIIRFLPVGVREAEVTTGGQLALGGEGAREGSALHAAEALNLAALAQVDRDGARTALETKLAFHGIVEPCPVWIWTQDQVQAIWDAWPKDERSRYITFRNEAIGKTPDRHVAASAAIEKVLGLGVDDLMRMRISLQIIYALYRPRMLHRNADWEAFRDDYLAIGISRPVAERLASVEVAW